MILKKNNSLKKFNTLSVDVKAKKIIIIKDIKKLLINYKICKKKKLPYLIIGEGSNILFLKNYIGIVFINRIRGINIIEKKNIGYYMLIQVKNGMN